MPAGEATPSFCDDRDGAVLISGSAGGRGFALSPAAATAGALALGALSAGVIALQLLHPVHASDPGARAAIETAIGFFALLSAALLAGDFLQTRAVGDLLLLGALATVSLGALIGAAVPHSGLATAAQHPVSLAAAAIATAILVLARIAFVRRGERAQPDTWMLAGVCFLLAASAVQQLALASGTADWITPGDGLRLLAYALLLAVAMRRYSRTRAQATFASLSRERERIARDLHDGLAQDLAFIGAHAQRLGSELGSDHPLTVAARRALAASRGTIADLAARSAPTTGEALALIADELGTRFDVLVRIRVEGAENGSGRDLPPAEREEVVRIAREAIVNAVRHGGAGVIDVVLDCQGGHRLLLVSDDGSGISDTALRSRNGFGLPTMQARAETLGGRLHARRAAHGGTELEVRLATPMPRGQQP